jgi:hypothetical protein
VEIVMEFAPKTRKISKKRLTNVAAADKLSGQRSAVSGQRSAVSGQRSALSSQSDNNLLNSRQAKLLKILKRASKRRTRDILRRAAEPPKGVDGL